MNGGHVLYMLVLSCGGLRCGVDPWHVSNTFTRNGNTVVIKLFPQHVICNFNV